MHNVSKILLLIMVLGSLISSAQELQNDNDTIRVQELINLANECRYYYPEIQIGYTREALKLSLKNAYSLGEGLALKGLGKYFFEQGAYDSSFYYYNQAKFIFSKLGNNKELANVIGDYCIVCINKGEYNKALEAGITALQMAEEMKDEEQLQYALAYLGYTYYSLKNYQEAEYYLDSGNNIAIKRGDNTGLARILTYLGMVRESQGKQNIAVSNYSRAADLLFKAGDKHSLGIGHFNRAEAFRCQKKYVEAIEEYYVSYQFVNQLNDQDGKNLLLLRISRAYIELLNSGGNISVADQVMQNIGFTSIEDLLSKTCFQLHLTDNKDNMLICLELTVKLKKAKKLFREAFETNLQLITLKENLSNLNRASILADLIMQYEIQKNNKELVLLELINKANNEKISLQRSQMIIFGIAVFMLISLLLALRSRIRTIARTRDELNKINIQLEQEIENAERNEQFKEQFLANVSHEIRTPLNAIIGITNILIKNVYLKNQEIYLEAMRISSKNLLALINDILDLSKLESGKVVIEKNVFSLRKLMFDIIDSFQERALTKKNELEITIAQNVPEFIIGDESMLRYILHTLIRNGISFTEGGKVSLDCRLKKLNEHDILLGFTVSDTGIGIIQEKQAQLLNSFVKVYGTPALDYNGSGLELTIIKHMVELQEGVIELESEPGIGTVFRLEIPYSIDQKQISKEIIFEPKLPVYEDKINDMSILLAEDNDFNIMVAQDELNSIVVGLKMDVAKNGRIALEMVQKNKYDLILMDLQMPEMNGFEATKAIRKLPADKAFVPIIAMTANTFKSEIDKCIDCGMDDFISKPFESKLLLEKLSILMRKKRIETISSDH